MGPHEAFEIIRTLGSIAGMVSTYRTLRNRGYRGGEELKEKILLAGEKVWADPEAVRIAQRLPKDLGEAANRRLRKAYGRYLKAWDSPMNVLELDKESELAAWEICAVLKLIKKHNGGDLPLKRWRDLWKVFECDKID
jgi:hypothetical protein